MSVKVCAVVGCGPGMGGSIAIKFAKQGFAIAAMNRTAESFAPTAAKLTEMGATFAFYPMDCSKKDEVTAAFAKAAADLGVITVLAYNSSGGGFGKGIMDIDAQAFAQAFSVSCTGALLCSQAVIPGMLASEGSGDHRVKKHGTLLFSSATAAFRGSAKMAQFACGKFALVSMSSLHLHRIAPHRITSHRIAPYRMVSHVIASHRIASQRKAQDAMSNVMRYDAMRCNAMQCDAMRCDAMQCEALQCAAMRSDAMQCDAMQCNAMHRFEAMQCDVM
jgi:pentapeptide MXKDX repeat protein